MLLILGVSLLAISNYSYAIFILQDKLMNKVSPGKTWKTFIVPSDNRVVERVYLLQALRVTKTHQFNGRRLVITRVVRLLLLGLL